jgi:uncharacterized membrane-anchored protein YhcB (DUF1043 family)
MHLSGFLQNIAGYAWYLIALGSLLAGVAVGLLLARLRTNWRLEVTLEETKQALEWERGERKRLIKQAMDAAEAAEERVQDATEMADERIAVLQKELQRLYHELQRDWRAHAEEEKHIHRLEAKVRVLSEKAGIIRPEETTYSVRRLAASDDKVLTLWNTPETGPQGDRRQDPDKTSPSNDD